MKNIYIMKSLLLITTLLIVSCNNSGGVWLGEGENSGKPYTFGSEQDIMTLQKLAGAYSEKNADELSKYYSEEYMNDKRKENYSKWLNSMESITMKPYKIIPLQNGGNFRQVMAWSKEERVHKNGSYEKLDLMESFVLDNDGKVKSFKQWKAIDSVNFGMSYGGKFFGNEKNENTGKPFVFSNRNETQIIENFVENYNNMDTEGMKEAMAEEFTLNDYRGQKTNYKKSDLDEFFKPLKSVNWKINAIIPIKIANTDAASGVIVRGSESRVFKNGRKWDKELMEIFYFNLEGKISSMEQFAK
ncbi:hypothetical protein N9N15_01295 [Flavobacteriaceae bacterium]|nr:hypothetical protein [Flavobacteriaceae bacterium]